MCMDGVGINFQGSHQNLPAMFLSHISAIISELQAIVAGLVMWKHVNDKHINEMVGTPTLLVLKPQQLEDMVIPRL
jgi:hypothetical protein